MKTLPKLDDRVRFRGSAVVGPCVGTVVHVYSEWHMRPIPRESEWHVAMRPDALPALWAYPETDLFAPRVADLELEGA